MKRFLKLLILLVVFVLSFSALSFGADDFSMAKSAFNRKDYRQANTYLVKYLTANPNDVNARYYYAQTLTYLNNYSQARIEYGYVMQLAPNTTVANYAQESIAYLDKLQASSGSPSAATPQSSLGNTSQEDFNKVDNYLVRAISSSGELNTWSSDKMPIKVYINQSNRPRSEYVNSVKNALSTWQSSLSGLVSFLLVDSRDVADVEIKLLTTPPKSDDSMLGVTHTFFVDGEIKHSEVNLYTMDKNYRQVSLYDLYNVALHEMGHMLGIHGHSDNKGDILYPSYDKSMNADKRLSLSPRDINTVKAMYSLDKNPYATGRNSINKVLGSKDARLSTKLEQDLDYANKFPNKPIAYTNLASTYNSLGKEAEALEAYKKALSLSPSDEKANKELAKIYAKRNDFKNAETYYKNLIKYHPNNVDAYKDLTNLYIKNNKIQYAKSTITTLLYRNRSAKDDPEVIEIKSHLGMN